VLDLLVLFRRERGYEIEKPQAGWGLDHAAKALPNEGAWR
jgi:hypothetical protein